MIQRAMLVRGWHFGQIAVRRSTRECVMFLGYWRNEVGDGKQVIGDWIAHGDQGRARRGRIFSFFGRMNAMWITSSGYRSGRGEIEDLF